MASIIPTITATSVPEFRAQMNIVQSLSNHIHIDIMDGVFAPTKSPPLSVLPEFDDKYIFDIHVMYQQPTSILDELILRAPNMVIVHAETVVDLPLFATILRENGIKTGLAVLPETPVDSISSWLPHVQQLLIFGGRLGYHGGSADLSQLTKVEIARKYNRSLRFGWDGGANIANVSQLRSAGIDSINVGSAIHSADDPALAYDQLVDAAV